MYLCLCDDKDSFGKSSHIYGIAQFKLEIYTCVALELFNKFVKPLVSYMGAHDTIP